MLSSICQFDERSLNSIANFLRLARNGVSLELPDPGSPTRGERSKIDIRFKTYRQSCMKKLTLQGRNACNAKDP